MLNFIFENFYNWAMFMFTVALLMFLAASFSVAFIVKLGDEIRKCITHYIMTINVAEITRSKIENKLNEQHVDNH